MAEYTGSKLVGDMSALITHLGRGPVTVFGHDWGAAVAYGLAMFAAPQVDRLIIANGVHPVPFQRALAAGGAQSEASQYMDYLRRPDSHDRLGAEDYAGLMALFSAIACSHHSHHCCAYSYSCYWAFLSLGLWK